MDEQQRSGDEESVSVLLSEALTSVSEQSTVLKRLSRVFPVHLHDY